VRSIELTLGAPLPDGYTSEINQRLAPWLQTLSQSLERGVMLFIDYGLPRAQYYRDERMTGTLLCHYRHRFHDNPFVFPGCRTSVRGSIFPLSPTAPSMRASPSPASRRRRIS